MSSGQISVGSGSGNGSNGAASASGGGWVGAHSATQVAPQSQQQMHQQPHQPPQIMTASTTSRGAVAANSATDTHHMAADSSPRESGDDSEDESEILEESPCGRWLKRREEVDQRDVPGIDCVHLAMDTEEGVEVVWNEVQYANLQELKSQEDKMRQVFDNLMQLDHQNIVKFHRYWTDAQNVDKPRVIFITEYMSSGSLKQFLKRTKRNAKRLPLEAWRRWCTQILSALSYLHSCTPPVIHGNLTCDSIFIQHNGLVKIGAVVPDAVHYNTRLQHCNDQADTHHFMAPEYGADDHLTAAVDIYAFGMCALEMAALEIQPSSSDSKPISEETILRTINSLDHELQRDLIFKCLRRNPEERPSAHELLFHPLLFEVHSLKLLAAHSLVFAAMYSETLIDAMMQRYNRPDVVMARVKCGGEEWDYRLSDVPAADKLEKFVEDVKYGVYPLTALGGKKPPHFRSRATSPERCDSIKSTTPEPVDIESRRIVNMMCSVKKLRDDSSDIAMTILLRMDDKMNRQLTCQVTEADSSADLTKELVRLGFVHVDDQEKIQTLLEETLRGSFAVNSGGVCPFEQGGTQALTFSATINENMPGGISSVTVGTGGPPSSTGSIGAGASNNFGAVAGVAMVESGVGSGGSRSGSGGSVGGGGGNVNQKPTNANLHQGNIGVKPATAATLAALNQMERNSFVADTRPNVNVNANAMMMNANLHAASMGAEMAATLYHLQQQQLQQQQMHQQQQMQQQQQQLQKQQMQQQQILQQQQQIQQQQQQHQMLQQQQQQQQLQQHQQQYQNQQLFQNQPHQQLLNQQQQQPHQQLMNQQQQQQPHQQLMNQQQPHQQLMNQQQQQQQPHQQLMNQQQQQQQPHQQLINQQQQQQPHQQLLNQQQQQQPQQQLMNQQQQHQLLNQQQQQHLLNQQQQQQLLNQQQLLGQQQQQQTHQHHLQKQQSLTLPPPPQLHLQMQMSIPQQQQLQQQQVLTTTATTTPPQTTAGVLPPTFPPLYAPPSQMMPDHQMVNSIAAQQQLQLQQLQQQQYYAQLQHQQQLIYASSSTTSMPTTADTIAAPSSTQIINTAASTSTSTAHSSSAPSTSAPIN